MAPAATATGAAQTTALTTRRLAPPVAAMLATHTAPAAITRLGRTLRATAASTPDARTPPGRSEAKASSAPSHNAAAGRSLIVCTAANSTGGLVATSNAALRATVGGASRRAKRKVPHTR